MISMLVLGFHYWLHYHRWYVVRVGTMYRENLHCIRWDISDGDLSLFGSCRRDLQTVVEEPAVPGKLMRPVLDPRTPE